MIDWIRERKRPVLIVLLGAAALMVLFLVLRTLVPLTRWQSHPRTQTFTDYYQGGEATRLALTTAMEEPCPDAPFLLPAAGYIGLYYGDPRPPYSRTAPHQGMDIFVPQIGSVSVYAAYDGYLTRLPGWRSSVIMRVPNDPLVPGRQIWLYYTHMADTSGEESYIDEAFPPGTSDRFVEQGTYLGRIGDFNGGAAWRIAPHLHFSIVLDDGNGQFLNELEFNNTVDPSRYLGMPVNYACAPNVVTCDPDPLCEDALLGSGGG
ncbi:MAG: M23 family metallopeptidase [Chloroflexi bacterium]|nr:M23 family metallopeptidase [Chloroflexota bacterium]